MRKTVIFNLLKVMIYYIFSSSEKLIFQTILVIALFLATVFVIMLTFFFLKNIFV